MPTVRLAVRGTRYYHAAEAQRRGLLTPGAAAFLLHEPSNPYDRNAVGVYLLTSNLKLGHVRKELAPKFARLVRVGAVKSAKVVKNGSCSDRQGFRPIVHVAVTYVEQAYIDQTDSKTAASWRLIEVKLSAVAAQPGVYTLTCVKTGRVYVGQSSNVRARIQQHFVGLVDRKHDNSALQSEFSIYGLRAFIPEFVAYHRDEVARLTAEAHEISARLARGCKLYNMTEDGGGRTSDGDAPDDPRPISDRGTSRRKPVAAVRVAVYTQNTAMPPASSPKVSGAAFWILAGIVVLGAAVLAMH